MPNFSRYSLTQQAHDFSQLSVLSSLLISSRQAHFSSALGKLANVITATDGHLSSRRSPCIRTRLSLRARIVTAGKDCHCRQGLSLQAGIVTTGT